MAKALDIVPVGEWGFFTLPRPMVIAGPCSVESEEQVIARDPDYIVTITMYYGEGPTVPGFQPTNAR